MRLSSQYEVDFVVLTDQYSLGIGYELIEIETPHMKLFTSRSDPSARLTHSIRQVLDWKNWVEENPNEVKKLFPASLIDRAGKPNFKLTVIVGKRSNIRELLPFRNKYADNLGIHIRSFDYLGDLLRNKHFNPFPTITSPQMRSLSPQVLNQLANPFFKAYGDREWRNIAQSDTFNPYHVIACNADLLLEHREYNGLLFNKFVSFWNSLPDTRKNQVREDLHTMVGAF
ncbi:MAG: hypothetical protein AYK19_18095 [Theionarchaea archaeon DG-70-1]|nr:MAG: hypothetical protein AYK19_18095 [Theionarchaea archaeon DG-70-1]